MQSETDEETDGDADDDDDEECDDVDMEDDDDIDEDTLHSEQEEVEDFNDLQPEHIDVKYDKIKEDESSKEPFFNLVLKLRISWTLNLKKSWRNIWCMTKIILN